MLHSHFQSLAFDISIIVLSYNEKKRRNQLWTLKIPITFLQKQKNQKENTAMTTALPPNVNAA